MRADCEKCGVAFRPPAKRDKRGRPRLGRFCSRDCYRAAVARPEKNCAACGEVIPETSWHHAAKFCSHACYIAHQEHGAAWKGGRSIDKDGYVRVWAPDHPAARSDGYALEHRMVMEEALGRPLDEAEVVHHFNGDKADNRIENLGLFATQAEHMRLHHPRGRPFGALTPPPPEE